MKLHPALFKVLLAGAAAGVGAAVQYNIVPAEYVPIAVMASTFLAGLVHPPKKA